MTEICIIRRDLCPPKRSEQCSICMCLDHNKSIATIIIIQLHLWSTNRAQNKYSDMLLHKIVLTGSVFLFTMRMIQKRTCSIWEKEHV